MERLSRETEDELMQEETEQLLQQLTALTELGRMTWRCTDYTPLNLMPILGEGNREFAFLAHTLQVQGEYRGQKYETEISEYLKIPEQQGSVDVRLTITHTDGSVLDYPPRDYPEAAQCRFAAAVLPQLEHSEVVEYNFDHTEYSTDYTTRQIATHPLTALGARLCREHRLLDFHRIVTDPAFLATLLSEQK